jgi:ribulose-phosphate 3-epimerase
MAEVIPAIIPESFEDLKEKMSLVNKIVPVVQVDVCDGKFVPSKCWPYINDTGEFKNIVEEAEGFPFWETLDFEADLMVQNPENIVEDWIKAGARRLIIHLESSKNIYDLVKDLRKKYGYVGQSSYDIEVGIGVNVDTPNISLSEFLKPNNEGRSLADFVQFMGIRKIGYQGQEFDPDVLEKISDLRTNFPDTIISVDGGVSFEDAPDIIAAGANRLVSGSAVYGSDDIRSAIAEMQNL